MSEQPNGHTPGPWRVEPDLSEIGKAGVLMSDNRQVALDDGFEPGYLDIADARLIAAAPDLLDACKFLLSVVGVPRPIGSESPIDRIRRAVGKAENREVSPTEVITMTVTNPNAVT